MDYYNFDDARVQILTYFFRYKNFRSLHSPSKIGQN